LKYDGWRLFFNRHISFKGEVLLKIRPNPPLKKEGMKYFLVPQLHLGNAFAIESPVL